MTPEEPSGQSRWDSVADRARAEAQRIIDGAKHTSTAEPASVEANAGDLDYPPPNSARASCSSPEASPPPIADPGATGTHPTCLEPAGVGGNNRSQEETLAQLFREVAALSDICRQALKAARRAVEDLVDATTSHSSGD